VSRKNVIKAQWHIFSAFKFFKALWPLATGHWLLASLRGAQPSRSEKPEARGMTPKIKQININRLNVFCKLFVGHGT
jgi:hypothetical protein